MCRSMLGEKKSIPIAAIYASPLNRTKESAEMCVLTAEMDIHPKPSPAY